MGKNKELQCAEGIGHALEQYWRTPKDYECIKNWVDMLSEQLKDLTKEVVLSTKKERRTTMETSIEKGISLAFRALKLPPAILSGMVKVNGEML